MQPSKPNKLRVVDCNCIKMLIDHGADVNAVDNSGKTVLQVASKFSNMRNYNYIRCYLITVLILMLSITPGRVLQTAFFNRSTGKITVA
jgi:ankyrin repeat protein